MAPTRLPGKALILCLAFFALLAPSALAAEGIGPAKKLGGGKTVATDASTATTSGSKGSGSTTGAGKDAGKEALSIATVKPGSGTTASGTIGWEVAVTAGAPSKAEFLVDGV